MTRNHRDRVSTAVPTVRTSATFSSGTDLCDEALEARSEKEDAGGGENVMAEMVMEAYREKTPQDESHGPVAPTRP